MSSTENQTITGLYANFKQKAAVVFALLTGFIVLGSVYLATLQVKESGMVRAEDNGRLLGKMIAITMGEDLAAGNFQALDDLIKKITEEAKIEYCLLLDNNGKILAAARNELKGKYFTDGWSRSAFFAKKISIRRAVENGRPVFDTVIPVEINGKCEALLRAGFSLTAEYENIRNLLLYNLLLAVVLLVIGITAAYFLSATLLSPVMQVLNLLEKVDTDDSAAENPTAQDKIAMLTRLAGSISGKLSSSSRSDDRLVKKAFGDDAELSEKNLSGKTAEAIVLHFESVSINRYIERNTPSAVVDMFNNFFGELSSIVSKCGGITDKISENHLTAVFPINRNDKWPPQLRAGLAALAGRHFADMFNYHQSLLKLDNISLKTGLAKGKVIIGHLSYGSAPAFSCLGSTIKHAAEAAALSSKSSGFAPVTDRHFADFTRDYMTLSPVKTDLESDENTYYTLLGFLNSAYFKERIMTTNSHNNPLIVSAFGMTEEQDAFNFLKESVLNESCTFRLDALRALAPSVFANRRHTKEFLICLLNSSADVKIRASAISILALSRDEQLAECFIDCFADDDERIRANAVEACISIDFPSKLEILRKMTADTSPRVCANAMLGLWLAGDKDILSSLYGMLKSDNTAMRASAAYAIGFLSDSEKFKRLFPAYSEQIGMLTLPVIENILNRLKLMLESTDPSECLQAVIAIGKVGGRSNRIALEKVMQTAKTEQISASCREVFKRWDALLSTKAD